MDRLVMSATRIALRVTPVALCLLATTVCAADFFDPTRPVTPPSTQSAPMESGSAPQVGVDVVVTAKEGVVALVDGRLLHVGSWTEEGVVVRIVPDAVFVRSAKGQERRIPLYPAVALTPAASKAGCGDRSNKK